MRRQGEAGELSARELDAVAGVVRPLPSLGLSQAELLREELRPPWQRSAVAEAH